MSDDLKLRLFPAKGEFRMAYESLGPQFNALLRCHARKIEIYPESGWGILYANEGDTPDRDQCIDFFLGASGAVRNIAIITGTEAIAVCVAGQNGWWHSYTPKPHFLELLTSRINGDGSH
jgi:hypothetical protein